MKTTGIVLLLLGLVLTIFTAFKFFTKEKVVDLGAVVISRNEPHSVSWSPVIGLVVMGIGGVAFWQGSKSNKPI